MSTPVPCNLSRARIKRVRAGVFFFSSLSGLDIEFKLTWLTTAKSRTVTRFSVYAELVNGNPVFKRKPPESKLNLKFRSGLLFDAGDFNEF